MRGPDGNAKEQGVSIERNRKNLREVPRSKCVWYKGSMVDWNSLDQVKLEEREERCQLAECQKLTPGMSRVDSANIKRKYVSHESHEGA